MNVFDLFAKLTLDTSEYDQGLKDAQSAGSSFGAGLASATRVGVAAIAAVGTAAVAAGTSLVNSASDIAEYGDNIDKMSQKVGMSAQAYQEWNYVMNISGTEMSSMTTGLKTLTNQLDEARNGSEDAQARFAALGLSMEELAGMSREDVFGAVITGFQNMEDSTERAALANDLFGRSGQELAPLFNTTAEETQRLIEEVHELGGVMSDDAVKASADFQDQLTAMQTAFKGVKRGLLSNFLPSLTTVMNGLTSIFSGNYDEGLEQISAGINEVVENITTIMPELIQIGFNIVEAIATSLIENLPVMLPALVDLVMNIANMIIENLPLLVETAMQIILQLATGIADALPQLLPTIVDVVIQIVNTLIDNVDLLIDASIALILGLAEGLINALPRLVARIPEIIVKIVETLISNVPKLNDAAKELITGLANGLISFISKLGEAALDLILAFCQFVVDQRDLLFGSAVDIMESFGEGILGFIDKAKTWGHDLINNFIGGIKDKINDVISTCKDLAGTIADYLGFSEPEKGPLSNFHTYAPDMIDLFTSGIVAGKSQIEDAMNSVLGAGVTMPLLDAQDVASRSIAAGSSGSSMDTVVELLSIIANKDMVELSPNEDQIFDIIRKKNTEFTRMNGDSAFA